MKALREDRIGRYELLIELGRGGMAELFLGRLHGAGGFAKLVAIKRILPHLAQDRQFKEMFLNEGRIAANLSHPNVCQVFELDEADDELFLAMEYLDGVSWDHLCRELAPGNFAMRLTAGVIAQACEGLHYAHTLRDVEGNPLHVVHRDVSPQNLFVTVDGVCKVLDFGVSKTLTDGPRTRSGVIKGKLPYMAPEQIRGELLDARADLFALGVCTWEALAGRRLFDRASDFMIWKAITEEDVPPIATHWPQCPPAVDAAVRRALERDVERRFTTAREFADALRAACPLPPCTPAEIADAVRTRCGERILERQRQVATAVSARKAFDPLDSAETNQLPSTAPSMAIRQESVTLDLRAETRRAQLAPDGSAAETHDLGRDIAETRASAEHIDRDDSVADLPARGHLRTTIVVAVIAAAATAAVVVSIMMMNRSDDEPPQPPAPTINIVTPSLPPAPPPPDAAPMIEIDAAIPVDAAPPARKRRPARRRKPAPDAGPTTGDGTTIDEIHRAAEAARKAGDEARKAGDEARKAGEELRRNLGQ